MCAYLTSITHSLCNTQNTVDEWCSHSPKEQHWVTQLSIGPGSTITVKNSASRELLQKTDCCLCRAARAVTQNWLVCAELQELLHKTDCCLCRAARTGAQNRLFVQSWELLHKTDCCLCRAARAVTQNWLLFVQSCESCYTKLTVVCAELR